MTTIPRVLAVLLACACFGASVAWADDADKVDTRVKAVESQVASDRKPADLDLKHAQEAYLAAYKKNCAAQIKLLEKAVKYCEGKVETVKRLNGDTAALEAKLADLQDELAGWKANADKKWEVKVEEKAADEKEDAKDPKEDQKAKATAKAESKLIGDWRPTEGGFTMKMKAGGTADFFLDGRSGLLRTDTWKIGTKGELVIRNSGNGSEATYILKNGNLVDAANKGVFRRTK